MFVVPMTQPYASEILQWRYPAPYDFYNLEKEEAILTELLQDDYYAALDQLTSELIGFFAYGNACRITTLQSEVYAADALDIGLGLRPMLTGRGRGLGFVRSAMEFAKESYYPTRFRLTVATFNQRAIRVYESAGFTPLGKIKATTGVEFLVMQTEEVKYSY